MKVVKKIKTKQDQVVTLTLNQVFFLNSIVEKFNGSDTKGMKTSSLWKLASLRRILKENLKTANENIEKFKEDEQYKEYIQKMNDALRKYGKQVFIQGQETYQIEQSDKNFGEYKAVADEIHNEYRDTLQDLNKRMNELGEIEVELKDFPSIPIEEFSDVENLSVDEVGLLGQVFNW